MCALSSLNNMQSFDWSVSNVLPPQPQLIPLKGNCIYQWSVVLKGWMPQLFVSCLEQNQVSAAIQIQLCSGGEERGITQGDGNILSSLSEPRLTRSNAICFGQSEPRDMTAWPMRSQDLTICNWLRFYELSLGWYSGQID